MNVAYQIPMHKKKLFDKQGQVKTGWKAKIKFQSLIYISLYAT